MTALTLFVGVYSHRHGLDLYSYATTEEVDAKKAEIAREYWVERADQDTPDDHEKLSDAEVSEAYFEDHASEWFEEHELQIDLAQIPDDVFEAEARRRAERAVVVKAA